MFLEVKVRSKIFSPKGRALFTMMCPGISYSTVHSLMFHTNGSVQNDKLYRHFCNRITAHFVHYDGRSIGNHSIDPLTNTLLEDPEQMKYDDSLSAITSEYEVITTFMEIHNISATWEYDPELEPADAHYQLRVDSHWCKEGTGWECCPPS